MRKDLLPLAELPDEVGTSALLCRLGRAQPEHRCELLQRLWREPVTNLTAWRVALVSAWRSGSWHLERRVGRATLARWWAAASWPNGLCSEDRDPHGSREELPESFEVYRGGFGDPDRLAQGMSWTRELGAACVYALGRREQVAPAAAVFVIGRRARREEVLWHWSAELGGDGEVVLVEPNRWSLVSDDERAIKALAAAAWSRRSDAFTEFGRRYRGLGPRSG